MRSILLLPLVVRCLETIDVCISCIFVLMSVVVTVCESIGKFVVSSFSVIYNFFVIYICQKVTKVTKTLCIYTSESTIFLPNHFWCTGLLAHNCIL